MAEERRVSTENARQEGEHEHTIEMPDFRSPQAGTFCWVLVVNNVGVDRSSRETIGDASGAREEVTTALLQLDDLAAAGDERVVGYVTTDPCSKLVLHVILHLLHEEGGTADVVLLKKGDTISRR